MRTDLGVFDHYSASDLPQGDRVCLEYVKDVHYNWILNCCLSTGIHSVAAKRVYKTNSFLSCFLQTKIVITVNALLCFSMTRLLNICRIIHSNKRVLGSWKKLELFVDM